MIRNAVAAIVGYIVGSTINMGLIQLNMQVLFPPAPGIDVSDPLQFNGYIATLPSVAFLVVLVAHLGQSFVGAWVAARLGASHPMILAMSIGVLSLAGGIIAMTMIEGPAWLMIELPLYLVVAWAAGNMEIKRRAASNAQESQAQ